MCRKAHFIAKQLHVDRHFTFRKEHLIEKGLAYRKSFFRVETIGFEPMTPCTSSRYSSQLS